MKHIFIVIAILWMSIAIAPAQEDHWIPDTNLRAAIIEEIGLPDGVPLREEHLKLLGELDLGAKAVKDLTRLEHAIHLEKLWAEKNQIEVVEPLSNLVNLRDIALCKNRISDISPLANLTNLKALNLCENQVFDISPLLNLTKLEKLEINTNQISDISPLRNLRQLRKLDIRDNKVRDITVLKNLTTLRDVRLSNNPVEDISPLLELPLLETLLISEILAEDITPLFALALVNFEYDELCKAELSLPSIEERVLARTYPSVFQAWRGLAKEGQPNDDELFTLHDLHWSDFTPYGQTGIKFRVSANAPTVGLSTQLTCDLELAKAIRQRRLELNPNYLFLTAWTFYKNGRNAYPEDSNFWLRDAEGQIIENTGPWSGEVQIDFIKPYVQDMMIEQIVSLYECGLFDGIMIDGFTNDGAGFIGREFHPATDEEIRAAAKRILHEVRARVGDAFLIIVNDGGSKSVSFTEYVNGSFMELSESGPEGYSYRELIKKEDALSWNEENLRYPQVNCLEGGGIPTQPPDSPQNLQNMRLFTTLALTHSNGYVLYTKGKLRAGDSGHVHIWYDFWDADLGKPVGEKAQLYENRDGLFIREFTNGWAVYNRSGQAQKISLPGQTTGVASGITSFQHTVPDLDGEMFLKTDVSADVNGDGEVNILDLVAIANAFGEAEPDLNGDGVVNIQDLVIVANAFGQ